MIDIEEQISNNFNSRFTSRFPGTADRIIRESIPDASHERLQDSIENYIEYLELVWQVANRITDEGVELGKDIDTSMHIDLFKHFM